MPRKQHTHHYIYKTTCKVTGKFYVGMHSTSNLEDDYIGSGKRLWYSIKKWGIENHEKEILEFLPDRSSLKQREREIVNEEFLLDPMCMNLKLGGDGGFCDEDHRINFHSKGGTKVFKLLNEKHVFKLKNDHEYRLKYSKTCSERSVGEKNGFFGKTHSQETRDKIRISNSEKQSGEKNSQFGTIWITNGIENKKISKNASIPDGWKRGRKKLSKRSEGLLQNTFNVTNTP